MPPKTNPEQAPADTMKKSGKADISSIMDDAPLFAGLDDFVLSQTLRKEAQPQPAVPRRKPQQTAALHPVQPATAAAEPPPQPVPKARTAHPGETSSMLLSIREMCSLLKISRATLVRMDKSGKLPGRIKLGGSVRFHRETVETWLQSRISSHPTQ